MLDILLDLAGEINEGREAGRMDHAPDLPALSVTWVRVAVRDLGALHHNLVA